jgi:hypothetical protein
MSDSRRQQIFDAVETRLKEIQIGNGYETDIGNKSNKWRATDFAADDLPCFNFRDPRCQTDQHTSGIHQHTLDFEVIAVAARPATMAADKYGRKMIADIITALGVDRTWSRLAYDTNPQNDTMITEQNDQLLVAVNVKFQILYRTKSFLPYT